jgi:hypothetical protein
MIDFKHLDLIPDNVNYVIYHNNCSDGFGAAFSAWKYLSTKFPDRKVTYHGANHYSLPPADIANKYVLICDFSYSRNILEKMTECTLGLAILDHHKSAMKQLQNIDDKYKVFNMKHSGANLAWRYFFPDTKIPLMIQYIEDRDLWTNSKKYIKEYAAWFFTLDFDFEIYNKYSDDKIFKNGLKQDGIIMAKLNKYNIDKISTYSSPKFVEINKKYYFVSYNNSNVLKSDIGNKIITTIHPFADFAAVYSIDDRFNSTSFSLRSTNKHVDVSNIAQYYGGGGHRNASGVRFSFVTSELPGTVLDSTGDIYHNVTKNIKYKQLNINNQKFNAISANITTCRKKLSMYLLQTKYVDEKTKNNIQTCATYLNKNKLNQDPLDKKYHVVFGWYFDTKNELYNLRVTYDKSVTQNVINNISKYLLENKAVNNATNTHIFYLSEIDLL